MDLGLKNRTAIVTGGSRGIGKAIANALADEGCNLVLCARGAEVLAKTADEIEKKGIKVVAVAADVTAMEGAAEVVKQALDNFTGIDILVNNVGGSMKKAFVDYSDDDWNSLMDLNLFSSIRMSRQVVPAMEKQGTGAIINISSIFGRELGGPCGYNTVKAAEIGFSKNLAKELMPKGIRVNSVAPGGILFPGGAWEKRQKADPDGIADMIKQTMPLGRFGKPEEVADLVTFLSSERASLIAGACINIDGCQSHSLI